MVVFGAVRIARKRLDEQAEDPARPLFLPLGGISFPSDEFFSVCMHQQPLGATADGSRP